MIRSSDEMIRQLDRELYALVTRLCFSSGKKKGEIRKQLEEFAAWTAKASTLERTWTLEIAEKTQDMQLTLRRGQPEEEIFEPLLRCVVEASSHIQLLIAELENQGKSLQASDSKLAARPLSMEA
jgi:hypothetical protein